MNTESLEKVKKAIQKRLKNKLEWCQSIKDNDSSNEYAIWGAKNMIVGLEIALDEIEKEIKS